MALGKQARMQQVGDIVDYNAAADKVAGNVVQVADLRAGIITADIDQSVQPLGSAQVAGIAKVRKDSSAFLKGDQVYWDNDGTGVDGITGGAATTTAGSGDFPLGRSQDDDGTAIDTGVVALNVPGRQAHIADADGTDDDVTINAILATMERAQIVKTS